MKQSVGHSLLAAVVVASALPAAALAQTYPVKQIRMIVPFPPGGGVDFAARVVGKQLAERLGQQVVIDNRPGANGIVGLEILKLAPADGYTLAVASQGPLSINPSIYPKLPYDSTKDFAPISGVVNFPLLLVVHPSLPVKSVPEMIALAKSQPGKLVYGSPSIGTGGHLSAELFKLAAGVDLLHVPYRGGAQGATELLGGHVMLMFATMSSVHAYVVSGRLRAIAVTSAKRSPAVPKVPTIAESGVPGFETVQWIAMSAPRGTPKPAIERLNAEIAAGMKSPDLRERLAGQGYQPEPSSPQQLTETVKVEFARFARLIKTINLKDE